MKLAFTIFLALFIVAMGAIGVLSAADPEGRGSANLGRCAVGAIAGLGLIALIWIV